MALTGSPADWKSSDMQGRIRDALFATDADSPARDGRHSAGQCAICNEAWRALVPELGTGELRFYRNGPAGREELPQGRERSKRLKNKVYEVHAYIAPEKPRATPVRPAAPLEQATPAASPRVPSACQRDAQAMIDWIQGSLRPFCEARNADGKPFDQIGLRPAENAARMLTQGIPVPAVKHALTLHYPPEARRSLDIAPFDAQGFAPRKWADVRKPSDVADHSGTHKALPYVRALALAGVPAALVGPPGTGKTTLARDLANDLGLDFGFVSMTRGTSPSAFNGRPKLASDGTDALVSALIANGRTVEALELAQARYEGGDTVMSKFERIYSQGGVWLFDELDASDPNLLLLTNAALANGHFANPATGKIVDRHKRFIPVAGMNTLGLGGDRQMVGREKQDAAALDRWNAGRVEISLDETLERHIYWNLVAA